MKLEYARGDSMDDNTQQAPSWQPYLAYLVLVPIWGLIFWYDHIWPAAIWCVLARFGYAGGIGRLLSRERHDQLFTSRWGTSGGYSVFRSIASVTLNNDAIALGLIAWTSRGTLPVDIPMWVNVTIGAILVAVGLGVKGWATLTIGEKAYYWYDFFAEPDDTEYSEEGPYPWLDTPMYSIGYAHAYGFPIALASLPGLIAGAFYHLAVLAFCELVERPHYEDIYSEEMEKA